MCRNINEHIYFLERQRAQLMERITIIAMADSTAPYLQHLELDLENLNTEIAQARELRLRQEFATVLKEAAAGAALFMAAAAIFCGLGWLWKF